MGWFPVGLAVAAAWFFGRTEHPTLFWFSVAVAGIALWSFGIMHNFAYHSSVKRHQKLVENMRLEERGNEALERMQGLSPRLSRSDTQLAPNWATTLNMGATILSVVLFGWSLIA